jgi:hypothetical protein
MMSDGSPCGVYGLSLFQESLLVQEVASVAGTTDTLARVALEAMQFDASDAIDLLVHAQWVAPVNTSQAARAASMRDLSQVVMHVCGCAKETADAVLRDTKYDADSAIDMLIHGLWDRAASSNVQPSNSTCCHEQPTRPENVESTSHARTVVGSLLRQGDYAVYVRTGETIRVLSVHTENEGAH